MRRSLTFPIINYNIHLETKIKKTCPLEIQNTQLVSKNAERLSPQLTWWPSNSRTVAYSHHLNLIWWWRLFIRPIRATVSSRFKGAYSTIRDRGLFPRLRKTLIASTPAVKNLRIIGSQQCTLRINQAASATVRKTTPMIIAMWVLAMFKRWCAPRWTLMLSSDKSIRLLTIQTSKSTSWPNHLLSTRGTTRRWAHPLAAA